MTKREKFIKKYSQNYQLLKNKFVNKDKELESDLDEVIKDKLEKFAQHWNSKIDNGKVIGCYINISDIESYLKSKQ